MYQEYGTNKTVNKIDPIGASHTVSLDRALKLFRTEVAFLARSAGVISRGF